ncbi:MAG: hypothetical protein Q4E64_10980 [Phascolarctobacterium sp.]|uniref:hypothetical protein n=1 Tax=Phascolarctobacterium sp. TaxID=2049039 RepID=UPI0026DD85DA|nr:hypothetical protein [Phascolarctobacterium sp.]MDO4922331.1 hypothetical protein [Phascolarctobacterium sp.]
MKKLSLITVFLAACLAAQVTSAQTITLNKAEKLVPQGWTVADDDLKFKKDTQALLNDDGETITLPAKANVRFTADGAEIIDAKNNL